MEEYWDAEMGAQAARRFHQRTVHRRHGAAAQQRRERQLLPDESHDNAAPVEQAHRVERLPA